MAVENISYSDVRKINNNFVSKAFSYAQVSAITPGYQPTTVSNNPPFYDLSILLNGNLFLLYL